MELTHPIEEQRKKLALKNPSIDEEHFIKAPNMKDSGPKKHECLKLENPPNTNQKEMENDHRNDPNRTHRAWWRPSQMEFKLNPKMKFRKTVPHSWNLGAWVFEA
jgi:hypothetical protein